MAESFDAERLMEQLDGDVEFLEETVEMLEEDAPELLDAIDAAITAGSAEQLVRPAHTVKGMLGNFFAQPTKDIATRLEAMAREGSIMEAPETAATLRAGMQRLMRDLHAFVEQSRA